jgi:hypothetical protein
MFKATDYVTTEVHETGVIIEGEPRTCFVRELPSTDVYRYFGWMASADEDVRAAAGARLVAMALCDADGKTVIDWEAAAGLRFTVIESLVRAVLAVNGFGTDGRPAEQTQEKKH